MSNIVTSYLEYGILAAATILLCAIATQWLLEDKRSQPKPGGQDARTTGADKTPGRTASDQADRLPAPSGSRGKQN